MSLYLKNRWFRGFALATITAIGLGILAIPAQPAQAQLYFGFGPGGFGVEVGTSAPYYYPTSPYYYHHYYPRYYYGW